MMKLLILSLAFMTSTFAHAKLEGNYTLVESKVSNGDQLCSVNLEIVRAAPDTLKIDGSYILGLTFNLDAAEGDLIISGINKGEQVHKSSNSSHGQKYVTVNNAVEANDALILSSITKEKMILVTTSTSKNVFNLSKRGKELKVLITRDFDEVGSSAKDWSTEERCLYQEL